MATGTVKGCNDATGYGFSTRDGEGEDGFWHHTATDAAGFLNVADQAAVADRPESRSGAPHPQERGVAGVAGHGGRRRAVEVHDGAAVAYRPDVVGGDAEDVSQLVAGAARHRGPGRACPVHDGA